jgi:hypothetical protein
MIKYYLWEGKGLLQYQCGLAFWLFKDFSKWVSVFLFIKSSTSFDVRIRADLAFSLRSELISWLDEIIILEVSL